MGINPPNAPAGEEELPPGTTIADDSGDVTTVGPEGELVDVPGSGPPPPPPTLKITTTALTNATEGTPYPSSLIATSGGAVPVTVTAEGLPAGLAFDDDEITGAATGSGSFSVTLTATDSGTPVQTATVTLTLLVTAVAPPPPPTGLEAGLYCTETPSTVEALAATLKVNCTRMSTYCGNPNNTSMPSTPSTTLGYSIGVGKVTQAEAETIGAAIYATGRRGTPYRIMWEYNSSGMSAANWYVPKNLTDAEYIAAFQPIATGLRAGDPSAVIVFNGNLGGSLSALTAPYPGDAFVDEVWIDYYDGSWRTSSTDSILVQFLEWAVARGKPSGFGEWGTWSSSNNGNNGSYISFMAGIFKNPAYGVKRQLLFSNKGDGSTDITHWPEAEAAYIADVSPLSA